MKLTVVGPNLVCYCHNYLKVGRCLKNTIMSFIMSQLGRVGRWQINLTWCHKISCYLDAIASLDLGYESEWVSQWSLSLTMDILLIIECMHIKCRYTDYWIHIEMLLNMVLYIFNIYILNTYIESIYKNVSFWYTIILIIVKHVHTLNTLNTLNISNT